jgi:hypothetical protein
MTVPLTIMERGLQEFAGIYRPISISGPLAAYNR